MLKHRLLLCILKYFTSSANINSFKQSPHSYDRYYHLILSQQHYFFLSSLVSFEVVCHILTQFSCLFFIPPAETLMEISTFRSFFRLFPPSKIQWCTSQYMYQLVYVVIYHKQLFFIIMTFNKLVYIYILIFL